MGVSVLQLYPLPDGKTGQQTIETLTKRIMNLGATQTAPFVVDCEVYTSQNTPNKTLYVLHNSEFPATVFSILESGNKTVTLTSANLFDLLMLKLGQVYQRKGTNAKIESKGPRFEIKDFVVKLGSVTTAGSFKGILVEVEYCPCLVPDNCWSLLAEFMQGFLGSCVSSIPAPYIKAKGNTTFTPEDTIRQYLDHFNQFRKSAKVF